MVMGQKILHLKFKNWITLLRFILHSITPIMRQIEKTIKIAIDYKSRCLSAFREQKSKVPFLYEIFGQNPMNLEPYALQQLKQ